MKKFNRNNDGYTLIELILTLAIFSIVMLGIGMLLRSTTITYGKGFSNVGVQQEAQIVANQIEELFVDANTNVSYNSTDNYWYADDNYLRYDSSTQQIWYQSTGAGAPSASNWSLMADYVTDFDIDRTTNTDNMIKVSIEMDNNGYAYNAVKEIFYRNNVEDKTTHNFDPTALPGGGDPSAVDPIIVNLDRYEILDLEAEYNIDVTKSITMSSTCSGFYSFYTIDEASGNLYLVDAISNTSVSTDPTTYTGFVSTTATFNSAVSTSVSESKGCTITATDKSNNPVILCLVTDKVDYNFSESSSSSDGLLLFTSTVGDHGRIMNWIDVKGMDVASYVNNFGGTFTCEAYGYWDSNGDDQLTYVADPATSEEKQIPTVVGPTKGQENVKRIFTIDKVSGENSLNLTSYGTNYMNPGQGNTDAIQIAIGVDVYTGDIFIAQGNNKITVPDDYVGGSIRIALNFNLPGLDDKVVDFNCMCEGNPMTNYSGGSKYDVSQCNGAF